MHTYTVRSPDETVSNRSSKKCLVIPNNAIHKHKIGAGRITSNYTSEFLTIFEEISIYLFISTSSKLNALLFSVSLKQSIKHGSSTITKRVQSHLNEVKELD